MRLETSRVDEAEQGQWWSAETGEALQTFYTMGANLKKIHVSADFTTFVTVDSIGIPYVLKKVEGGSL